MEWFYDTLSDSKFEHENGYYRMKIIEPIEKQGWINWENNTLSCVDEDEFDYQEILSESYNNNNFPGINGNPPFIVHGDSFCTYFHSNSNDFSLFGFKMFARICNEEEFIEDIEIKSSFEEIREDPKHKIYKSLTPYLATMEYIPIEFDDCIGIEIAFDIKSKISSDVQYITIFKDDSHIEYWGNEKYFGREGNCNFPGVDSIESLYIPSNHCVLYFYSEESVDNDYKWRIAARPSLPSIKSYEGMKYIDGSVEIKSKEIENLHEFIAKSYCNGVILHSTPSLNDSIELIIKKDEMFKVCDRMEINGVVWLKIPIGETLNIFTKRRNLSSV